MTEDTVTGNGYRRKAEQLLNRTRPQQPPEVADLTAAIRGVGFALLAIQDEITKLRSETQQQTNAPRR